VLSLQIGAGDVVVEEQRGARAAGVAPLVKALLDARLAAFEPREVAVEARRMASISPKL